MKSCPNCKTRYTDDSLKFCLQDGTPLVPDIDETSAPTVVMNEADTVVNNRPPNMSHTGFTTNQNYLEPEKKSNTFKIVALTLVTMLVVLGGIGAGALFYFNSQKEVVNTNTKKNTKTVIKETPAVNKNENDDSGNTAETPAPIPEKTSEINTEKTSSEVSEIVNSLTSLAEDRNLEDYMSNYADTLEYYNKKSATRDFVRGDKKRTFDTYESIVMEVSNIKVTAGMDGETATAVYDKEWAFESAEKFSEGKVQSQLKFELIDGEWKIVSEKDLKVYYVNKE